MANIFKYTDATGPAFVDGTTTFTATFGLQSLLADRTYTFPDASGTIALTVGSSSIVTVGTITTGVWHGTLIGVTYGGTGANLSATGGASQVVMQTSSGGAFTVAQLELADLSDAADVALLASPTFTGVPAAPTASGGDDSTQIATTAFVFNGGPYTAPNIIAAVSGGSTTAGTNLATSQNFLFISAGTMATYEIAADSGTDGTYDGQIIYHTFNNIVTALTYTGANWGSDGLAVPTAAAAGQCFGWVWDATHKWVRFQ